MQLLKRAHFQLMKNEFSALWPLQAAGSWRLLCHMLNLQKQWNHF